MRKRIKDKERGEWRNWNIKSWENNFFLLLLLLLLLLLVEIKTGILRFSWYGVITVIKIAAISGGYV